MRFHLTLCLLAAGLTGLIPGLLHAGQVHVHGTAGFSASLPDDWMVQRFNSGLELSKGRTKLAIENLDIANGTPDAVLNSLTTPVGQWKPVILKRSAISKPYAGLRAALRSGNVEREVAILQTPIGYFMLSLEPLAESDQGIFDSVLSGFLALDAAHLGPAGDLKQFVRVGAYELAMPEGAIERNGNGLLWKSPAHGTLSVELLKRSKDQPLAALLAAWEKSMIDAKTSLKPDAPARSLMMQDRAAITADYNGRSTKTRVQLQALDATTVLQTVLIARNETFNSHQALVDAIGFSVMPADGRSATSGTAKQTPPAQKKATGKPATPKSGPAAGPKSEPAQPTAPAKSRPTEESKREKSLWEKMSESVKKGSGAAECTDAQRSLNQCR